MKIEITVKLKKHKPQYSWISVDEDKEWTIKLCNYQINTLLKVCRKSVKKYVKKGKVVEYTALDDIIEMIENELKDLEK